MKLGRTTRRMFAEPEKALLPCFSCGTLACSGSEVTCADCSRSSAAYHVVDPPAQYPYEVQRPGEAASGNFAGRPVMFGLLSRFAIRPHHAHAQDEGSGEYRPIIVWAVTDASKAFDLEPAPVTSYHVSYRAAKESVWQEMEDDRQMLLKSGFER